MPLFTIETTSMHGSWGDPRKPHLAGVDADVDCGSVGLLPLYTLNVDDVLLPVDLDDFANLLAFVVSTNHLQYTPNVPPTVKSP